MPKVCNQTGCQVKLPLSHFINSSFQDFTRVISSDCAKNFVLFTDDPGYIDTDTSSYADWDVGTIYDTADRVLGSDGLVYQSRVDSNTAIDPTTDTLQENWTSQYLLAEDTLTVQGLFSVADVLSHWKECSRTYQEAWWFFQIAVGAGRRPSSMLVAYRDPSESWEDAYLRLKRCRTCFRWVSHVASSAADPEDLLYTDQPEQLSFASLLQSERKVPMLPTNDLATLVTSFSEIGSIPGQAGSTDITVAFFEMFDSDACKYQCSIDASDASQDVKDTYDSWVSGAYSVNDIVLGSDNELYKALLVTPDDWDNGVTYNTNDVVLGTDGVIYQSLIDSNLAIDPVADGGVNWAVIGNEDPTLDAGLYWTTEFSVPIELDWYQPNHIMAAAISASYGFQDATYNWTLFQKPPQGWPGANVHELTQSEAINVTGVVPDSGFSQDAARSVNVYVASEANTVGFIEGMTANAYFIDDIATRYEIEEDLSRTIIQFINNVEDAVLPATGTSKLDNVMVTKIRSYINKNIMYDRLPAEISDNIDDLPEYQWSTRFDNIIAGGDGYGWVLARTPINEVPLSQLAQRIGYNYTFCYIPRVPIHRVKLGICATIRPGQIG